MAWRFVLSFVLILVGIRALSDPIVTSEASATVFATACLVVGIVGFVIAWRRPSERRSAFHSLLATTGSRLFRAVAIAIVIFAVFAILMMTGVIDPR